MIDPYAGVVSPYDEGGPYWEPDAEEERARDFREDGCYAASRGGD